MADISFEIDRIAQVIADKSNKAVEEVVDSLIELTQNKPMDEAMAILSDINLRNVMELKMAGAFTQYEQGITTLLTNMYTTTALQEFQLRMLMENTRRMLSSELIDKMSSNLMQNIIDGISTKKTTSEILNAMDEITPDLETLVVTAYGQYSNSVANLLSLDLPENTKFVYIGAYDSKTRDRCVSKIEASPATREEIVSRFGDMNNEIWNCRHRWEQMSSSPIDQGFNKDKFEDA